MARLERSAAILTAPVPGGSPGLDLNRYRFKSLVSYQTYRQLSAWDFHPLAICALGAHYTSRLRTHFSKHLFGSPLPEVAHGVGHADLRRRSLQGPGDGRSRSTTTFIFMNIVGVAQADIFSTCVFNNIVGVASFFNSLFSLRSRRRSQLSHFLSTTYIF